MTQEKAQTQAQYQYQFQPPLFPIQQWTRSFPSPSPKSSVGTAVVINEPTEEYIISTDPSLVSLSALDNAFAQEYMYWAKPLPANVLKDMIDRSLCFGVYGYNRNSADANVNVDGDINVDADANTTILSQIGFARLITDNITFAYLTDVYILPEYQGTGLGSWLLQCINEWMDSKGENFRRLMFVTVGDRAEGYYQRVMGAETQGRKGDVLIMGKKGKGALV